MEHSILEDVFTGNGISQKDLTTIGSYLKKIELNKGDFLLHKGDTVSYTHYVYKGCLRSYVIDETGKDHTLQFAIKDWWISDYTSLFSGGQALMTIQCIQDTTLYRLSRKHMVELYEEIPAFETYFRKKLEKRIEAFHQRTLGNLAQTAKERYKTFIQTYPMIEQQVKNYHIASYLGITTESLSRVRKEMAQ
ncbi:MAG: Crp/Fnr family transcriptional regulator [Cytophagales bacterium]|nr:Crp/Fnr family transcriptional regulator [Cytophagales bacterium]